MGAPSIVTHPSEKGCLIMKDFNNRFGDILNVDGTHTLSANRQSIITSLLSAGCVSYWRRTFVH